MPDSVPDPTRATAAQMKHERDLLADALGRVLVASGAATDQPLTGPQLLLLADDYIEHLTGARPKRRPAGLYGDPSGRLTKEQSEQLHESDPIRVPPLPASLRVSDA